MKYSDENALGFTKEDMEWYYKMWTRQNRSVVTELELHDLAQSNSEHSRHHIFLGKMYLENKSGTFSRKYEKSLFDLVKRPLKILQQSDRNR